MTRPTSVYVCECIDRVKIGIAVNPEARRHHLSVAAPYPVRLAGSREFSTFAQALAAEQHLHAEYRAHRVHGEWFAGVNPADVIAKLNRLLTPTEELRAALEEAAPAHS